MTVASEYEKAAVAAMKATYEKEREEKAERLEKMRLEARTIVEELVYWSTFHDDHGADPNGQAFCGICKRADAARQVLATARHIHSVYLEIQRLRDVIGT